MSPSNLRRTSTPSRTPNNARPKSRPRNRNTSILNFFEKTDAPPASSSRQQRITQFTTKSARDRSIQNADDETGGLFIEDKVTRASLSPFGDEGEDGEEADDAHPPRLDQSGTPVKKRKLSPPGSINGEDIGRSQSNGLHKTPAPARTPSNNGPFIDESDEEDDFAAFHDADEASPALGNGMQSSTQIDSSPRKDHDLAANIPPLVREATSHVGDDEFGIFDDLEEPDEFQEEGSLNPLCDEDEAPSGIGLDGEGEENAGAEVACPICQSSLAGLKEEDVSVHVNSCLDGVPSPVSTKKPLAPDKGLTRSERAAIPRPAQQDPVARGVTRTSSAFSKMMAGNAEDTAWSTAAANEVASRGKQAYQRTCPFYKIIPGFSICVDAFRYGAVQGCTAYFLSHFHSDHYIGLTASWRHGPIYCSKITGNLVRQQLKVDPKWIVDLEFEKKTEIPDTGGVQVTMIEANHCPGSSLFLLEKPLGPGPLSKVQRVLHCGDFRASPAHVQHPALRPETFDSVTGQRLYQKIDACYLDTTYLSPKYSFPSQDDVVLACADLCVSLSEDDGTDEASWQKKTNGGSGSVMSRFFRKPEPDRSQSEKSRQRGRLLVVIGTYSIGKERICLAIARALQCKIYATAAKQRVCACLEDEELSSLLTDDPLEAQLHMQTIFEIRAETLSDYLNSMKPHFSRVVGFRPTGWTYRPPAGRVDNPSVSAVLHSDHWKTAISARDLVPQRGNTRESACFGVPYSEHSSFCELTMFCCALRIGRVIPTVNVSNAKSRERMKGWIDKWEAEKRKNGEFRWTS